jgi:hypothetical protein
MLLKVGTLWLWAATVSGVVGNPILRRVEARVLSKLWFDTFKSNQRLT